MTVPHQNAPHSDLSGRCLCGQVTWHSNGPILWAGICHCESCRRANSAPMVPFFGVPRDQTTMSGPIRLYHSSDGVERGFCTHCGTPIFYKNRIWPQEMHLMAATLQDLSLFEPQAHYHWAERIGWATINDGLVKYPGSADAPAPD